MGPHHHPVGARWRGQLDQEAETDQTLRPQRPQLATQRARDQTGHSLLAPQGEQGWQQRHGASARHPRAEEASLGLDSPPAGWAGRPTALGLHTQPLATHTRSSSCDLFTHSGMPPSPWHPPTHPPSCLLPTLQAWKWAEPGTRTNSPFSAGPTQHTSSTKHFWSLTLLALGSASLASWQGIGTRAEFCPTGTPPSPSTSAPTSFPPPGSPPCSPQTQATLACPSTSQTYMAIGTAPAGNRVRRQSSGLPQDPSYLQPARKSPPTSAGQT